MAQELGIALLISRGVRLLTASGDDLTASDDPSRKMMRQIAGAFAEYEKARLVAKLQGRPRPQAGRGRSVRGPIDPARAGKKERRHERGCTSEAVVAEARRLRRASPKTGERRSLRKIAAELASQGHLNERGEPYSAKSVRTMLAS